LPRQNLTFWIAFWFQKIVFFGLSGCSSLTSDYHNYKYSDLGACKDKLQRFFFKAFCPNKITLWFEVMFLPTKNKKSRGLLRLLHGVKVLGNEKTIGENSQTPFSLFFKKAITQNNIQLDSFGKVLITIYPIIYW